MLLTQSGVTPNMRRVAEDVVQAFDEDPKEYLGDAEQVQAGPLVGGTGMAQPGPTTPLGGEQESVIPAEGMANLAALFGAGPGTT
jgi:hypothetical protein